MGCDDWLLSDRAGALRIYESKMQRGAAHRVLLGMIRDDRALILSCTRQLKPARPTVDCAPSELVGSNEDLVNEGWRVEASTESFERMD